MRTWFSSADFRGCAFLNAAAELGSSDPEILKELRQHKLEMASVLERLMKSNTTSVGATLSLVIDGAIVHSQMDQSIDEVKQAFISLVEAILRA